MGRRRAFWFYMFALFLVVSDGVMCNRILLLDSLNVA